MPELDQRTVGFMIGSVIVLIAFVVGYVYYKTCFFGHDWFAMKGGFVKLKRDDTTLVGEVMSGANDRLERHCMACGRREYRYFNNGRYEWKLVVREPQQ